MEREGEIVEAYKSSAFQLVSTLESGVRGEKERRENKRLRWEKNNGSDASYFSHTSCSLILVLVNVKEQGG